MPEYDIFSECDLDPERGGPDRILSGVSAWLECYCISRDDYLSKRLAGTLPTGWRRYRQYADKLADGPAWYWEAFACLPLHHDCITCGGSGLAGEMACPECDGLGHSMPPTDTPSEAATAPQSGPAA